ncbi:MAG: hypothetical protein WC108_00300 [Bacteroidales bacterium]
MKKTFLKRRIINLLLLLVLLTPFVSCKDNDEDIITYYDTYVEGYITDFHTGQPIAGVVFDAKYFDESNGSFGTDPYFVENIAVSNSEGYYKIKIPKHGELGSREMSVDFYSIRVFPRATSDYSFEFGTFNYKMDSVNIISKRVDIRPITYGYLKVILPKTSSDNWGFWDYPTSTYERPCFKEKLVSKGDYNDTLKYFFFKVVALNGSINCGNYPTIYRNYNINNPRDTVTINVEQ